jgi:hypothetical protein
MDSGFSTILGLPMPDNGIGSSCQPLRIHSQLGQCGRPEVLNPIRRRMPQWLEQAGADKNWNIMRGATEIPRRFLGIQTRWRSADYAQEIFSLTVHW